MENLNQKQKEAVLATDGPVLVIAGAGAGKTKTLTHRIFHLINQGVAPANILAITFTNKAAKEMRDRVWKLLKNGVWREEVPFISTFHALGVHILRENHLLLDAPKYFNIFDKDDSKKAIKEALGSLHLDPKQYEPGKILAIISKEKGKFVTQDDYAQKSGDGYFQQIVAGVWDKYEEILNREKAFDFDDLLLKTAILLKQNQKVKEHYQNLWKYILIDEYQDTNEVQYIIAKLLSEKHKNIFAVGDVDQNIYTFRGANIKNIMNFEKDYPEAKIILLEENYRSTKNIIKAANKVIAKNQFRLKRDLFTENPEGEKISKFEGLDENHEGFFIAQKSKSLIDSGIPANEIAVLFRANFQSRVLEEQFFLNQIPYRMIGTRFFDRAEIKNILSYIKAAINPESFSDIKRIINFPPRGIGKVTLLKIFEGRENSLPKATKEKVENFKKLLSKIKEKTETLAPSDLIKFIIAETGLEKSFKKENESDMDRLENIKELVSLALKYDDLPAGRGLEQFLTEAALAAAEDIVEQNEKAVRLMTVHAAKGLEFDCVFICGLEDGLFPHKKSWQDEKNEDSEEERRLFYVALTRAKKKVFLSNAQTRTIFGSAEFNAPSEFLYDIDPDLLEDVTEEFLNNEDWRKPLLKIDF